MSALSAGNLITFSKDYGRRDVKGREESERRYIDGNELQHDLRVSFAVPKPQKCFHQFC